MSINRRQFIQAGSAAALLGSLTACAGSTTRTPKARVVVVGGGFGGATVAKYLRMWSAGAVEVTLIERQQQFVSCPMSNLVLGGYRQLADLSIGYERLRDHWGVQVIHDEALAVDPVARSLQLARHGKLTYDRLVLSPGIDFIPDAIPGLAKHQEQVLHAWKAGAQTVALRRQLEALPDGGRYVLAIPKAPYRCPPGPYERAAVIASYFKRHKPGARVLILDANDDIQSKKGLFLKAWKELYPGMIEYRPNSEVRDVSVDARGKARAILDFDQIEADILNLIPPHQAGNIARAAGIVNVNQRWCNVDWLSMESTTQAGIHVLGDAVFPAPTMPKSGHMANQHGKLAAAAILNLLDGRAPSPQPLVMNTCYSFVDRDSAIHVASVHQYDAAQRTLLPVPGSGGVSAERNHMEAITAAGWAKNIWADLLG